MKIENFLKSELHQNPGCMISLDQIEKFFAFVEKVKCPHTHKKPKDTKS